MQCDRDDWGRGFLADHQMQQLIDMEEIQFSSGKSTVPPKFRIQPASFDTSIGERHWPLEAAFLPKGNSPYSIEEQAQQAGLLKKGCSVGGKAIPAEGVVLNVGDTVLFELNEALNLPFYISAVCSPKSSIGRLDAFVRVVAASEFRFNQFNGGKPTKLYLQVSAQSFPLRIRKNAELAQLRFYNQCQGGNVENDEIKWAQEAMSLTLSLDLDADFGVCYVAKDHSVVKDLEPIDVSHSNMYEWQDYWRQICREEFAKNGSILKPNQFCLFKSVERIEIRPDVIGEMAEYSTPLGEFRSHYAGFFDPGFGVERANPIPARETGAAAVLEVRARDIPFYVRHNQPICRLVFKPMSLTPKLLYGDADLKSSYQHQGLKLSKQFKQPVSA